MPNRILKDSICTSPNIDRLSREAEVFFYRLIVQCDDFGRMDARYSILRARCYPLQLDAVNEKLIAKWLAELVGAELVMLYTVDGQSYLQMRTWDRHQQVRAKRSKYPDMQSSDINCNQVIANVPVIQSNPIDTNVPAEAVPTALAPLSEQFALLVQELKTTNNKAAALHHAYVNWFGPNGAPDYGYLGKAAKQVGGAGRLAQLMFELVPRPPVGDVLAYIVAEENARKKRAAQTGGNREIAEVTFAQNGADIYG